MTREERDEMIWLYAAGALGDAEMQSVRALLEEGSAGDLASLAAARETLARLPESLDQVEPSDAVLTRVMKRIGSPAAVVPTSSLPRPRRAGWVPILVTAAAACVAVVAGLSAYRARSESERAQKQLGEALAALASAREQSTREIQTLRQEVDELRIASAKKLDELVAQTRLLSSPGVSFASLEKQELPKGGGRVLWDKANRQWHVFVFDLAPPPPGKVYELWFIDPSKPPVPAGTFTVDADGKGQIVSTLPEGMENVGVAAITIEPEGGTQSPTGPIVLKGSVQ